MLLQKSMLVTSLGVRRSLQGPVSHPKLPVFVIGVLMLLVQVSCSMGGVSSPCSRNPVNANIFWDHGNIPGIILLEILWMFLMLTTQRSLVNLQKMTWKIRTL